VGISIEGGSSFGGGDVFPQDGAKLEFDIVA
jgi:hypothetical protein